MIVVGKIFGTDNPLGNPHLIEFKQNEFTKVAGRDDICKEKSHHFAPNYVLFAKTEIPIAVPLVKVIFA